MFHLIDSQGILIPDSQTFTNADIENVLTFIEHNNPLGCGYATYIQSDYGTTITLFILVDGGTVDYAVKQSMIQEVELCHFNPEKSEELVQNASGEGTSVQS